jgi:hypothetical protein
VRGMLSAKLAAAPLHPFFYSRVFPAKIENCGSDGSMATRIRLLLGFAAFEFLMPAKEGRREPHAFISLSARL